MLNLSDDKESMLYGEVERIDLTQYDHDTEMNAYVLKSAARASLPSSSSDDFATQDRFMSTHESRKSVQLTRVRYSRRGQLFHLNAIDGGLLGLSSGMLFPRFCVIYCFNHSFLTDSQRRWFYDDSGGISSAQTAAHTWLLAGSGVIIRSWLEAAQPFKKP